MENTEQNLLEEPGVKLVPAAMAKRLCNYLIDFFIFCFLLAILLIVINPVYPLMQKMLAKQPVDFTEQLMINFLYGLYMAVMETVLKGKTLGKYITGTRAVSQEGLPVDAQTAFKRGLIRIIPFPFEQLSMLLFPPYPWHDKWTNSFVVDESKSILPKK
ncbi:MAG: RDD family protein [Chitinophagaceae bacterium]